LAVSLQAVRVELCSVYITKVLILYGSPSNQT